MGESQAISHANGTEQQTQERRIQQPAVNPRRGRFATETPLQRKRRLEIQSEQRRRRRQQQTAEQREHHLAQMVSAMTSYSSLTSQRIFISRQHSTESDCEFHQCPKYSRRAVFSSSAKQCLLSVNLKLFLMQTEQQTQERQIVNTRRGRFDTEESSGARTPT